jgi:hypothetical protein
VEASSYCPCFQKSKTSSVGNCEPTAILKNFSKGFEFIVQRKFGTHCHYRFFQDIEYCNDNLLKRLNLLVLHNKCRHFYALFLINVLVALNVASLSSKQLAFGFLLGTF